VRLQRGAGVEVLHHDLRTAPRLLTAEALAETGTKTPPRSQGGSRPQGGRSYAGGDRKPYRGQGGAPRRPEGGRGDTRRPATGGQRWSDSNR
jgi:hypothetical protein